MRYGFEDKDQDVPEEKVCFVLDAPQVMEELGCLKALSELSRVCQRKSRIARKSDGSSRSERESNLARSGQKGIFTALVQEMFVAHSVKYTKITFLFVQVGHQSEYCCLGCAWAPLCNMPLCYKCRLSINLECMSIILFVSVCVR